MNRSDVHILGYLLCASSWTLPIIDVTTTQGIVSCHEVQVFHAAAQNETRFQSASKPTTPIPLPSSQLLYALLSWVRTKQTVHIGAI